MPSSVVAQWVLAHAYGFQGGKVIEQRIGRTRHQDFIAGVSQKLEEVAVRFTGAGGQQKARGRHVDAALAVIKGDCFARRKQTARLRIVVEGTGAGESC